MKDLGDAVGNATFDIPPLCQDAMEVAVVVAAGVAAPPAVMSALGFTADGVEAESLAALWQSTIGNVEKGSVFARLQSAGARGLLASESMTVTGIAAVAAETFCASFNEICKQSQGCDAE